MKISAEKIKRIEEKFYDAFVVQLLKEKLQSFSNKRKVNIALSGGNTPLPILEKLKNEKLSWDNFNFFLVDERIVPMNSNESNYKNIKEVFFNHITSNTFPMLSDNGDVNEMIMTYEKRIKDNLMLSANGLPIFDLMILGMGVDGHTASLFPNTKALEEQEKIIVKNEVPQLNSSRITLTFPVLLNSHEIIVLLKGVDKQIVFDEINQGFGQKYPISNIIKANTNWIISK